MDYSTEKAANPFKTYSESLLRHEDIRKFGISKH